MNTILKLILGIALCTVTAFAQAPVKPELPALPIPDSLVVKKLNVKK